MTWLLALTMTSPAEAQENITLPALSPRAEVMQTVGVVEITVNYASPGARDRKIFGDLVPYGELWRTGANSATTMETSGPILIGGVEVPAGKYALFTVPGEDEWTFVVNKNPNQGGTGRYDKELDVLRTQIAPVSTKARERLTFTFADTTDASTKLELDWAGTSISVPIEVDTASMVTANVDAYVDNSASNLVAAARHHSRNENWGKAMELAEASIGLKQTWFNTWILADIQKKSGDRRGALKTAKLAHKLGKAAGDDAYFWRERVEKALVDWRKRG